MTGVRDHREDEGMTIAPPGPLLPPRSVADAAAWTVGATKVYGKPGSDNIVTALNGVSVAFRRGHFSAIMGPSGSGKSTLLHCLAGLDTLTAGQAIIAGQDLSGMSDRELTELRRDRIGFVFQAYNLVPTLTALENITLPAALAGRKPDQDWLDSIVATLHLGDRLSHRPTQLSGGQQQRVACARALASRPDIIFADEPSGNLDSRSSGELLQFLQSAVKDLGQTIVMVTHDPISAAYADMVVFLADGSIVDEINGPTAEGVLDRMKGLGA
jgi:putative ABC transport system ATP-binding protein